MRRIFKGTHTPHPVIEETQPELHSINTRPADTYLEQINKLIPAEIVAGFLAIDGLIGRAGTLPTATYWFVFAFLILLCGAYTYKATEFHGLPLPITQILATCTAFAVWVVAIGGPFQYYNVSWWSREFGSVLLVLFTLSAPLLVKEHA